MRMNFLSGQWKTKGSPVKMSKPPPRPTKRMFSASSSGVSGMFMVLI